MTALYVREPNQRRYRVATPAEIVTAAPAAADSLLGTGELMESPSTVRRYLTALLAGRKSEAFYCLYLDSRHRLVHGGIAFTGTVNGAAVYPREIVRGCLEHNAAALIVAHNHPSGNPEPSAADRGITARLREALMLVDVRLLDHYVVGGGRVESFAERGWL